MCRGVGTEREGEFVLAFCPERFAGPGVFVRAHGVLEGKEAAADTIDVVCVCLLDRVNSLARLG